MTAIPADAARLKTLTLTGTITPVVTVTLDGPPGGVRALALASPNRLVIDLAGVDAAKTAVDGTGAARSARIGQFDPDTARLVIDLVRPMRLGSAVATGATVVLTLAPVDAAGFTREVAAGRRVVVAATAGETAGAGATKPAATVADFDLPADGFGGAAVAPDRHPREGGDPYARPFGAMGPRLRGDDEQTAENRSDKPAPVPPPKRGAARPLVVIDAGHGGKDVGTISVRGGAYEKDVVLAIARRAAAALEKRGLVRVKLTRADDRFIPLPQRVAIARAAHADLFVSIHADAAPNPLARGASVYTLSQTASDAVAARLAARENKADIIAGVNLGIDAPDVGDILIDLVQRATMNVSVGFAETLQEALDDRIGFRTQFHHFAGFRVLKAADVPSVLLETGYLSNADDAATLQSTDGQRRIGDGIARAVEAHFARAGHSRAGNARAGRVAAGDAGPHMGGVKPNGG